MAEVIYRRVIEPFNTRDVVYDDPMYMTFCDICDDVRYYDSKRFATNQKMDIPRCLNCGFWAYGKYHKRGRLTQKLLRKSYKHWSRNWSCCHVCHIEIDTDRAEKPGDVFRLIKEHQIKEHNMKFGKGVSQKNREGAILIKQTPEETYSIPALELSSDLHHNIKAMLNGYEPKYENNRKLSKCCSKICDSYGIDEGGYGFCSTCGELAEFYEEHIEMVRNKEIVKTDYYEL